MSLKLHERVDHTCVDLVLIDAGEFGAELAEDRLLRRHHVGVEHRQRIGRNDPVPGVEKDGRKLDDLRTGIVEPLVRPASRLEVDDDEEGKRGEEVLIRALKRNNVCRNCAAPQNRHSQVGSPLLEKIVNHVDREPGSQ